MKLETSSLYRKLMLGRCLAYERSVTLKLAVQTESSREMHGQIWGLSHPPHTPWLLPSSLACIERCMPAGGATDALQGRISLALGAVAYLYLTAWLLITVCSCMRSRPGSKRKPPPHAFATTSPLQRDAMLLMLPVMHSPSSKKTSPFSGPFHAARLPLCLWRG